MISHISVVIISHNAERTIRESLASVYKLTDDIILVDAHSSDQTVAYVQDFNCKIYPKDWTGYGDARNFGATKAKYDWILSIDTDEVVSEELFRNIQNAPLETGYSFLINRINYIGDRAFKFGELAPEWKERIYHKELARWNSAPVHEKLIQKSANAHFKINGALHHYAYQDIDEMRTRYQQYAKLGHEPNPLLQLSSPFYGLAKSYVLKLGFLEGKMGWETAKIRQAYTASKYA